MRISDWSSDVCSSDLVQALGGSVIVQRHFDPEDWLRLVDRHRVTTSFSAPTPLRRVVDLPDEVRARYDTSSLTSPLANAAPWPFQPTKNDVEPINATSTFEISGPHVLGVKPTLT